MLENTFKMKSPLGINPEKYDGVCLLEVINQAIVSVAIPRGGEDSLRQKMSVAFGVSIPTCGHSNLSKDGIIRFLGLQRDQFFAVFDFQGDDPVGELEKKLYTTGYYTDQSDGWLILKIVGPLSVEVLERICPLDLDSKAFPIGAVSRTNMEHQSVILLREKLNSFFLISPRSSASSFFSTVKKSIEYVL